MAQKIGYTKQMDGGALCVKDSHQFYT